jgi:hypothetical protein
VWYLIIEGGILTGYVTSKLIYDSAKKIFGKVKDAGVKVYLDDKIEDFYKGMHQKFNKKEAERKFQNHDLQRAVIRSYYNAVIRITDECLEQSIILTNEYRVNLKEISEAVKSIQKEIKTKLENLPDEKDPVLLNFNETSLLLTPNTYINSEEQSKDVEKFLCTKTLNEFNIDTPLYKKLVIEKLYDYISRFFALAIKEEERVFKIFTTQLNIESKVQLNEILLASSLIADLAVETNENVKLILNMMLEFKSTFYSYSQDLNSTLMNSQESEAYLNRKALELRQLQFRIDNADILENLEHINTNLFRVSLAVLNNAAAIRDFLNNIEYLESTLSETDLKDQLSSYKQRFELEIEPLESGPASLKTLIDYISQDPRTPYRKEYKDAFLEKYNFNLIIDMLNLLDKTKELYTLKIKHGFKINLNLNRIISELMEKRNVLERGGAYQVKSYEGLYDLENQQKEDLLNCLNILEVIGLDIKKEQEFINNSMQVYLNL